MNEETWAKEKLEKIWNKYDKTLKRHGKDFIFYEAENGTYQENKAKSDIIWWTNGFDPGIFWQLDHFRKNNNFEEAAQSMEAELDKAFDKYQGLHHDVGFMWLPSAVEDYRLTDNERSYWRGRHAADLLAGRFNIAGNYLRSWNKDRAGWVIIDSMFNIQLLYWASEVTKDPRFKMMADAHAHTVMKNHVRPDGSVAHIVVFDPNTGEAIETLGGQGYEVGSSWSRGQAWALAGFAYAYRHTNNSEYLATSKRVANYFIANIAQTGYIPRIDFRAPELKNDTDTSAATAAACGLLELAKLTSSADSKLYRDSALKILHAVSNRFANYDEEKDGILTGAATAYHDEDDGHNINLNYGDYFFIEALLRILDDNLEIF